MYDIVSSKEQFRYRNVVQLNAHFLIKNSADICFLHEPWLEYPDN